MRIYRNIALLLIIIPLSILGQDISRDEYIRMYSKVAINQMKEYGVPASITLAQAILESNNGNSYLAVNGKNHFGIKCHNWTKDTITKDDDKKNECFRKYDNSSESYKDYALFLTSRDRYSFLFELKTTDYKRWAKGLRKAHYATDRRYPKKLIRIIEDNNLDKLDIHTKKSKRKE